MYFLISEKNYRQVEVHHINEVIFWSESSEEET